VWVLVVSFLVAALRKAQLDKVGKNKSIMSNRKITLFFYLGSLGNAREPA